MSRRAWSIALALGSCGGPEPASDAGSAGAAGGAGAPVLPAEPPDLGPCPIPGDTNTADPNALTAHPDNDPGCPAVPGEGSCASPATLCGYDVPCQSGIMAITFACSYGYPSVDAEEHERHPCSLHYDQCESIDIICQPVAEGGHLVDGTGAETPISCPWDRPAEGSACTGNFYHGPECGYWCDDRQQAWTVAECMGAGSLGTGYWIYDDACRLECTE